MDASTLQPDLPMLLIIDDEPYITELFQKYMTKHGFAVLTANSGPDGLGKLQSVGGAVRLVLTDMSMPNMSVPEMDGLAVARALFELRPDLPVLIATGHDTEQLKQLVPANVKSVIRKPYKNSMALEFIREILGIEVEVK